MQASKGVHIVDPAGSDQVQDRADHRDREEPAVHHPVPVERRLLGDRNHRHALGSRPRAPGGQPLRHRLHPRARQRAAGEAADPGRCRRCVRRVCGRCWPASPTRPASCPANTPCVSPVPGLVIVAGGKYTTYRVMAEDAINEAVKDLPGKIDKSMHRRDSADRRRRVQAAVEQPGRTWPTRTGLGPAADRAPARPVRQRDRRAARPDRGGTRTGASRCPPRRKYLKVEAKYAVSHEGALHLDDILARRTRISIDTWDRGDAAAQEVAELVAPLLGWDAAAVDREVDALPHPGGRRTGIAADARRPNRRRGTARRGGRPGGGGLSREGPRSDEHVWVTLT